MCGIIGAQDRDIRAGMQALHYRGRDGYGLCNGRECVLGKSVDELHLEGNLLFGHALHAIVDVVPQPLLGKGMLVVNCEIYNWQELAKRYALPCSNDAELLFALLERTSMEDILGIIDVLDGDYAFAYARDGKIILARDVIGVKPLWYSVEPFAFASEKKALQALGLFDVYELNPRHVLIYAVREKTWQDVQRPFFSVGTEHEEAEIVLVRLLAQKLDEAVRVRIPKHKPGILFSGGIDSTLLAWICKKHTIPFTCYVAGLEGETLAEDVQYARMVAKELDFPLKEVIVPLDDVERILPELIPLIESSNVVKVGVALPFYFAAKKAQEDGVRVLFSGLGSEELFAGYERHVKAADINKECLSGLLKIYERDLYRDDVVTMFHTIELRVPFLDRDLIDFALKIPAKYKLEGQHKKMILRKTAIELGIPEAHAMRPKRAAQYGSRFDKALEKLAKKNKCSGKSEYLRQFYPSNMRLGVLFSTGKDSNYALHIMRQQNYEIACLITVSSKNPDSYMFHTPNIHLAKEQADCLGIPLILVETAGEKEAELEQLREAMQQAKDKYKIDGIVTGALYSTYQRNRVEVIADELGLKLFHPLWHKDQEEEMRQLLQDGFKFIFTKVAAEGLDKSWLGRVITDKDIDRMVELNKKYGINIAGEGGEFESFVVDGPTFRKKLRITSSEIVIDGTAAELRIRGLEQQPRNI